MKRFGKIAAGALLLAGAATVIAVPAQAQVSFGVGIGGPVYGGGYYGRGYGGYGASCDPRSRWYNPYRCGGDYGYYDPGYYAEPYYGGGYYSPGIYFGGYGGYGGYGRG